MGDQNKNVPRLRFPGYTDAWVKCELGKVITFVNGRAYKQEEMLDGGKYKILRVGNFYTNDSWYYSDLELPDNKYIDNGDLIYTWSATFGPHIWSGEKVIYHYHIWKVVLSEEIDKKFVLQILDADRAKIIANSNGSTMIHITKTDMESKQIVIPNIDEQRKIGELFKHLDDLIAVNERELNKLKNLKKSYLEKMFPKNGSDIPELRFPGYTDAWVKCELGKVITFVNGRAYKQEEMLDGGKYKILRVGNFYTNDSWYYSDLELPDNKYIDNGDLIYTWSATFGPHIWSGEKVIYHYHIWKVVLSEEIDKKFVLQILDADRAKIIANSNGSTMIHITKTDMESKQIVIPNIDEQRKIGELFKHLDDLIAVNERELNKLKNLKKSYLEKMFPKNGTDIPELRFPGYTDAWVKCEIGKFSESYSGGTPSVRNIDYYGGNIPFIRSAEINANSTELFLTEEGIVNKKTKMVQRGDILYALYGATSGEVGISRINGAINQAILAIKLNENKDDSMFLMQWLQKQKAQIINTFIQGGQGNLSGQIVKNLIVSRPCIEEQKQIGAFFNQLNNTITVNERELNKLKELKKSYLKDMFV